MESEPDEITQRFHGRQPNAKGNEEWGLIQGNKSFVQLSQSRSVVFDFQTAVAFGGALGGPMMGVFILGVFFPRASTKVRQLI